ncbi:MAG: hypothetical protein GF347_03805 [Candidatus Moranbacteria bacterium]|nr:hypothetical protein [Candidatus Moranbacteria bacterium]
MKRIILFLSLALMTVFSLNYRFVWAGTDSIVPCGPSSEPCTMCHFVEMIQNVFDLVFKISLAFALLFIVVGGIMYIVSAGNEGLMGTAKNAIKFSLVGFGIILLAWVIVNTLVGILQYKTSGSWWDLELTCEQTAGTGTFAGITHTPLDEGDDSVPDPGTGGEPTKNPIDCEDNVLYGQDSASFCAQILNDENLTYTNLQGSHVGDDLIQCASEDGCVESGKDSSCDGDNVVLNKVMLKGLLCALSEYDGGDHDIGVSAVAGGEHTNCSSNHYSGQALDISRVDGQKSKLKDLFQECFEDLGCSYYEPEVSSHLHITCPGA